MEVEQYYYQGDGWQVANFGRISEVKLVLDEKRYTYILLFIRESQGEVYSERISEYLQSLYGSPMGDGAVIRSKLENFLKELNYRTMLKPADLAMVVESEDIQVPEFYKQAAQDDETRIVQF